jgi:hypothetical protein
MVKWERGRRRKVCLPSEPGTAAFRWRGRTYMPKRARLEKAVGSASPETFTTRFATDGFGEKDRGRKRCEGARRKEQRSGVL